MYLFDTNICYLNTEKPPFVISQLRAAVNHNEIAGIGLRADKIEFII